MTRSRSILKKLPVIVMAVLLICTFAVSCGGATQTGRTFEGNVPLNDKNGIDQNGINAIATAMLNNAQLYEGIVAAYRGYNILDTSLTVNEGDVFEAKTKLVPQQALDEAGNPKVDAEGNPVYIVATDASGNEMVDENGAPVYVTVEVPDVDMDAALAVIAKYGSTISTTGLDEQDIVNLVETLKYEVTFETQRGFWDNVMYGIGVVLGWITNTLGFGNYILGICVFAIFLEIVLLPLGIHRQKNSIKQAKLRPKEMAIKNKYAGRNDQATMQKMQAEIQEMYQKENFNPASGCLPLLIQLPIIMVLYSIVVDPLKHVLGISGNMSSAIRTFFTTSPLAGGFGGKFAQGNGMGSIEVISKVKEAGLEAFEGIKNFAYFNNGDATLTRLGDIFNDIPSFNIGKTNFGFAPNLTNFNWLLLVPVLTFAVYFASSKLTRKFMYQSVTTENQQMGCSNNMMDIMMPAISVYFTFQVPAAVGVYWMFKSVLSTIQQFILVKAMPLPTFTEEDYKKAEKEMSGKGGKNAQSRAPRDPNAPRPKSLHHIDDEDYDEHGVYKPVDHSKDAAKPAEENGGEKKNAALPKGAVPLKEDAPVREKKDTKKAEEPKEESVAEEAAQTDEENK